MRVDRSIISRPAPKFAKPAERFDFSRHRHRRRRRHHHRRRRRRQMNGDHATVNDNNT